jgi:hypothetical protein
MKAKAGSFRVTVSRNVARVAAWRPTDRLRKRSGLRPPRPEMECGQRNFGLCFCHIRVVATLPKNLVEGGEVRLAAQ